VCLKTFKPGPQREARAGTEVTGGSVGVGDDTGLQGRTGIADTRRHGVHRHCRDAARIQGRQAGDADTVATNAGIVEDGDLGQHLEGAGRIAADQAAVGAGDENFAGVVVAHQGGGIKQLDAGPRVPQSDLGSGFGHRRQLAVRLGGLNQQGDGVRHSHACGHAELCRRTVDDADQTPVKGILG